MACVMDIGEKDCIHPSRKKTGSKRLALLALEQTYGMKNIIIRLNEKYTFKI